MINFTKLLLFVTFLCTSAYCQSDTIPEFRGEITFEKYITLDVKDPTSIPEYIYELETVKEITYYVLSDSVIYRKIANLDGEIKYTKKSLYVDEVFSLKTMSIRDMTSGFKLPTDVKEKFRRTKEQKAVAGLSGVKFIYSTNKDDNGVVWVATNFPYFISLDKDLQNISMPIYDGRLEIESSIESEVTEAFNWTRHSRLISYRYDPSIDIAHIKKLFNRN
jgi:hypothetical protein